MTIGIIGLGLIGGSIAKNLKKNETKFSIIGYNRGKENSANALKMELIDEIVSFQEICSKSNLIILAVPVNIILKILPKVLNLISNNTVVTDVGSTKEIIIKSIENHSKRKRFVGAHPMSGTENSGVISAKENLFFNKITIICDRENSDIDAVENIINLYKNLGSYLIFMTSKEHDEYVTYISHLSHVISYVLAASVLEKYQKNKTIFKLASGGFFSTTRLAKSSGKIWMPIFEQNMKNIISSIDYYINKLNKFKNYIKNNNYKELNDYILFANSIKTKLDKKNI